MRAAGALLMAMLLLSACGTKSQAPGNGAAAANESAGAKINYSKTVSADVLPSDPVKMPMKEFMGHVMQHGGEGIWRWQGFVSDEKGERSLFPQSDKDWEDAESGAWTLAELTNLLMMPGRHVDDPKWDAAVAGVRELAIKAAAAAEKHDKDAFFAVGGDLDEACDNCHKQFIPNFVGPGAPPPASK